MITKSPLCSSPRDSQYALSRTQRGRSNASLPSAHGRLAGCDAIVFCCQNQFPEPFQPDRTPYRFPNWTRLVYGGGGLWSSEEDIYNPPATPRAFKAWLAAGGKTRSGEQVKMRRR